MNIIRHTVWNKTLPRMTPVIYYYTSILLQLYTDKSINRLLEDGDHFTINNTMYVVLTKKQYNNPINYNVNISDYVWTTLIQTTPGAMKCYYFVILFMVLKGQYMVLLLVCDFIHRFKRLVHGPFTGM